MGSGNAWSELTLNDFQAVVALLPEEADEETIQGKKYYVYDGTYYRPFASDGETIYMVVDDPRAG